MEGCYEYNGSFLILNYIILMQQLMSCLKPAVEFYQSSHGPFYPRTHFYGWKLR